MLNVERPERPLYSLNLDLDRPLRERLRSGQNPLNPLGRCPSSRSGRVGLGVFPYLQTSKMIDPKIARVTKMIKTIIPGCIPASETGAPGIVIDFPRDPGT